MTRSEKKSASIPSSSIYGKKMKKGKSDRQNEENCSYIDPLQ